MKRTYCTAKTNEVIAVVEAIPAVFMETGGFADSRGDHGSPTRNGPKYGGRLVHSDHINFHYVARQHIAPRLDKTIVLFCEDILLNATMVGTQSIIK